MQVQLPAPRRSQLPAVAMSDDAAGVAAAQAEVAALREALAQKEAMLEVAALKRQLAEKEEQLALQAAADQQTGEEEEYVPTVPELLEVLRSPYQEEREEAVALLAELVTTAYGSDGEALGNAIRDGGGVAQMAWMLADPSPTIQQQALLVLGNLCSNSVDPNSALTKRALLQAGAERALLGCLHAEEAHTLTFACAALQNLCHEPVWSELVMAHGKQQRLEELTLHDDPMVVRCAARSPRPIRLTFGGPFPTHSLALFKRACRSPILPTHSRGADTRRARSRTCR